jgi:hypothetical protein
MPRELNNNNSGNSDRNNWKNTLPLSVDEYAMFINKNWNNFTINVVNTTAEQVNRFLLYHILYY